MPAIASNHLLHQLPPELRQRIVAVAEPVSLPIRSTLYVPGKAPKHLHFVTSGIASVVAAMSTGDGVEVGLVGREGVPEAFHLLGPAGGVTDCFVQVAATALRVDFNQFREEFFPLEPVRRLLLQYVQYGSSLTGQIAACNRLHEVEQRMARWLLMVADRIGEQRFSLTQEFLAEMIGSRRSTVTLTAGLLKRSGLITYQRGQIEIIDRAGLEASACECYPITRKLLGNLQH